MNDYRYGDEQPAAGNWTHSGLPHPENDTVVREALVIKNDGPDITETNFFDTGPAKAGMLFLSFNARMARLLVPAPLVAEVEREIRTARRVQTEMGPCPPPIPGLPPHAYRIIFDDRSDSPFYVLVGSGQYDRIVPGREHNTELPLTVYGPGLRVVKRLPGRFWRRAYLPEVDAAIRDMGGV